MPIVTLLRGTRCTHKWGHKQRSLRATASLDLTAAPTMTMNIWVFACCGWLPSLFYSILFLPLSSTSCSSSSPPLALLSPFPPHPVSLFFFPPLSFSLHPYSPVPTTYGYYYYCIAYYTTIALLTVLILSVLLGLYFLFSFFIHSICLFSSLLMSLSWPFRRFYGPHTHTYTHRHIHGHIYTLDR